MAEELHPEHEGMGAPAELPLAPGTDQHTSENHSTTDNVIVNDYSTKPSWQALTTEVGVLQVRPLDLTRLKLHSDCLTINRVPYVLYGPLFRDGDRWTAFKPGRAYDRDPDFTLVRCDNMNRQGSHAAYRKAVWIVEAAVNAWSPPERELALLTSQWLKSDIDQQQTKVRELQKNPDYQTKYKILLKVQEDYLASLFLELQHARSVLNHVGGDFLGNESLPTSAGVVHVE